MKLLTIKAVLDNWANAKLIATVSDGVSDNDVWCMARLAAIIAGKRAQDIGNDDYEEACADFVRAIGGEVKNNELD